MCFSTEEKSVVPVVISGHTSISDKLDWAENSQNSFSLPHMILVLKLGQACLSYSILCYLPGQKKQNPRKGPGF